MQATGMTSTTLPQADADSLRHSRRVVRHLHERIDAANGTISFAEYMHEALYAPGLGYYSAGNTKFGAAGDFVTAPEISPLFGRVLATTVADVFRGSEVSANIIEFGAGSGALALQILDKLSEIGSLPESYQILEVSPELVARQRSLLQESLPDLMERVSWVSDVPQDFSGVVIAMEVLDALPIHRFRIDGDAVMECRVAAQGDGFRTVMEKGGDLLGATVRGVEADIGRPLPDGFQSEICLALPQWIAELGSKLSHALALFFDYGVSRREYYANDRDGGWLRCYFRHHVHHDPFLYPGIQDITAWVDLTAVAKAATGIGMQIAACVPQGPYLLAGGLDAEFEAVAAGSQQSRIEAANQVRTLTLPGEMGENVKCIALSAGDIALPDDVLALDRAHTL